MTKVRLDVFFSCAKRQAPGVVWTLWNSWLELFSDLWSDVTLTLGKKKSSSSMLMKILWKWSHWSSVWFLTAPLCRLLAICSSYSRISVFRDIRGGEVEVVSLIHSNTSPHRLDSSCWDSFRGMFQSQAGVLYDCFCLLLGCCFPSMTLYTFMLPFPHQLGSFVLFFFFFASSSCSIILQRLSFSNSGFVCLDSRIIYFGNFPSVC